MFHYINQYGRKAFTSDKTLAMKLSWMGLEVFDASGKRFCNRFYG